MQFHHAHGLDLKDIYGPGDLTDYMVHFVNYFDPNGNSSARQGGNETGGSLFWPRYTPSSPQLLTLQDGPTPMTVGEDNFRKEAIKIIGDLALKYPL